ncbi:MAG: hypothetical protein MJ061_06010 [Mailhella sp.]|nr:hypothetical protein [Mailhella sp.]
MAQTDYIGVNIDQVLGQEFLTWLWYRSETAGIFAIKDREHAGEPFSVTMEQRIVVRGGEGDDRETTSVSGAFSPLREARLGLLTGKQVVRALIHFEKDGMDWQVSLRSEDLSVNSLKTPKVDKSDASDDPDAIFLEKMYLLEQGTSMIDSVFAEFLSVRLAPERWKEEAAMVAKWMRHDISGGTMNPQE